MDRQFTPILKKAGLLLGALFLGWAAQAQSTTTTPADSTHHQYGMHHGRGHRPGADSLSKASGFHRNPGGHDGFRRPDGQRGFGRDGWANRGGRGHGIRAPMNIAAASPTTKPVTTKRALRRLHTAREIASKSISQPPLVCGP